MQKVVSRYTLTADHKQVYQVSLTDSYGLIMVTLENLTRKPKEKDVPWMERCLRTGESWRRKMLLP